MPKEQKRKRTLLDFYNKKCRNALEDEAHQNPQSSEGVEESGRPNSNLGSVDVETFAEDRVQPHQGVEQASQIKAEKSREPRTDADSDTFFPPNDILACVGKDFSNAEKLWMLKNIAIPHQSFNFPITKTSHRNLRFQYRWLIRFKWLAYSQSENGAFFKYCVLFGSKAGAGVGNQLLGTLCAMKFQR